MTMDGGRGGAPGAESGGASGGSGGGLRGFCRKLFERLVAGGHVEMTAAATGDELCARLEAHFERLPSR